MKKSNSKSTKTTALPKPETTIIATIEITKIVDDQMTCSDEAKQIIKDIIYGINGIDADHVEIKNVKYFERVED